MYRVFTSQKFASDLCVTAYNVTGMCFYFFGVPPVTEATASLLGSSHSPVWTGCLSER